VIVIHSPGHTGASRKSSASTLLDGQDVDNPGDRGLHCPVDPFEIDGTPLFDNGDFKAGLGVARVIAPVSTPDSMTPVSRRRMPCFGKLNPFNPDAKPHRPLLWPSPV